MLQATQYKHIALIAKSARELNENEATIIGEFAFYIC